MLAAYRFRSGSTIDRIIRRKCLQAWLPVSIVSFGQKKSLNNQGFKIKNGGGGEIRTHGRLPFGGFQDRCLQPLGHSSTVRRGFYEHRKLLSTESCLLPITAC